LAAYRHLDAKFTPLPEQMSEKVTSRPEQMSAPQLTEQPADEQDFIIAVRRAKRQFALGTNDMQKGASRPTRAREICTALPSFQIQNWVGAIEKLTSNSEGKGVVEIKIDDAVVVKTWNNALSDIGDRTLIDPTAPLFNKVSVLEKGQKVLFSGSFFHKDTDCVEESSLTLEGSITSPDFIMKFSDIHVFSEQASPSPIKKSTPDTSTRPGTLAAPPPPPTSTAPYRHLFDESTDQSTPDPAPAFTAPPPAAPAPAAPASVPSTPVLHVPPKAIRERSHPEWKAFAANSREFREIQESCSTLPAGQVSECWYQEREAYDWSVAQRTKFPKEKYPKLSAKRVVCWDVAKANDVLRFTEFKNCVSSN
jgi:hypothetical protein